MPRDIWLTSDPHFGHEKVIKWVGRPFSSVEEMDETLIQNWNRVVKPEDLVYHLGDFAWGVTNAKRVRPLLNGTIRLIVGNHDEILKLVGLFQRMYLFRIFQEQDFIATHIPLRDESFRAGYNVHGHIHNEPSVSDRHINVSVEQTNYTPIHIEDICTRLMS